MMNLQSRVRALVPRRVRPRALSLALLLGVGAMALGARCIDRTSTHVDADGYTHITGEMVNDSDVQGTQIMLQGTLHDANDNVVAQKTAPTCPPDTQPHEHTIFDIRFDNPNVPPWTRFDVRPISGSAQASPLPNPKVVLFSSDAIRFTVPPAIPGFPITDKDVFFAFDVRNQSDNTYAGVQGCAAVYDQAGNVVFVDSAEVVQENPDKSVVPATLGPQRLTSIFWLAKDVPKGPIQVRAWLWFGPKGASTSPYQFVSTGMITIQALAGP